MRVRLETLGCRLNEAEIETWARELRARGFAISTAEEPADVVIVNSCAVTAEAVRKSRKLLRRRGRDLPDARLVLSGCWASLEQELEARAAGADLVVHNRDKDRLVEILVDQLALEPAKPEESEPDEGRGMFARGRQRAFIKIQDGCRYQCTFCVTTIARGAERSKTPAEIIRTITEACGEGIQEAVLTGVQLGGWRGPNGECLAHLLEAVLDRTDIQRLRLGSLEPWDLDDGLWSLLSDRRLMPHLHLPMQSGSPGVLKRMARRCKPAEFLEIAARARSANHDLHLSSDIIVGFPGESDDEWRETIQFVKDAAFGKLHIFNYSARAGTLAADMPDQTPARVKRERSEELQRLAAHLMRETLTRQRGKRCEVLIESPIGTDRHQWSGYTPNYLPVRVTSAEQDLTNRILQVELNEVAADGACLLAEQVPEVAAILP